MTTQNQEEDGRGILERLMDENPLIKSGVNRIQKNQDAHIDEAIQSGMPAKEVLKELINQHAPQFIQPKSAMQQASITPQGDVQKAGWLQALLGTSTQTMLNQQEQLSQIGKTNNANMSPEQAAASYQHALDIAPQGTEPQQFAGGGTVYKTKNVRQMGALSQLGIDTENKSSDDVQTELQQKNPVLYNYLSEVGNNNVPVRGSFGMSYNQVSEVVKGLFPQYDPTIYPAKEKLRQDYTSGKDSQTLDSLNTALHHSDLAYGQVQALDNGKFRRWNTFGNFLKRETGDSRVDTLNNTLGILNREVNKAISQGVITNEDKSEFNKNLNAAQSKEVASSVIDNMINLLGGRLQPKLEKWQNTFGDFSKFPVLYKSSLDVLNRHNFNYNASTGEISGNKQSNQSWSQDKEARYQELLRKRGE